MTPRVDLHEFRAAYIAEADEQLAIANAKLLLAEAAHRAKKRDPRSVRDLFRALHTLKGLSSMVGIEPVVAIAHQMETVLRTADRSGGALGEAAIDTLLRGARAIELRVRALERGAPVAAAPAALLAALAQLEDGNDATAPSRRRSQDLDLDPALAAKLASFEKDQLLNAGDTGMRALRMQFVPSPSKAEAGYTINTVRERLGALGEIVKVLPLSVAKTSEAPGGLAFVILLVTQAPDDQLFAATGVEATSIVDLLPRNADIVPVDGAALTEDGEEALGPLPIEENERRGVLRVDVARVDDAMDRLAALIVTRSRMSTAIAKLAAAGVDTRELSQIATENARQLRDLRSAILQVRMVQVAEIFERVPLVVRAARRQSGKLVRLDLDSGGQELDKAVAERVFPALVHIVRNAVDHGIETPEIRRARGKPEEAVIRVACTEHSNTHLTLTISDDGGGIDRLAVARKSQREIGESDAALLDVICEAGLSTLDEVSTTSGRGMGMDIVKRVIVDQLGGELFVSTELGRGTTFTLRVPLTIAIIDAFTLECAGQRFIVPVSVVEEIMEIEAGRTIAMPGASRASQTSAVGVVERRGEAMVVLDLARVLHLRGGDDARKAVVVRHGGEPVCFLLHRVVGQQEAVVRPLVDPLVQVHGVPGATDLGDGRLTLVLDLVALAAQDMRPRANLIEGRALGLLGARAETA